MIEEPRAPIRALIEHLNECPAADESSKLTAVALSSLGVQSAYPSLRSSPFEAGRCMGATNVSLSFLGHTAYKWRTHDGFEAFLERISLTHGHARFLLSEDVSVKTLQQLLDYQQRFRAFEARIYLSRPLFRLVIQDDELISLQHYEGLDMIPIGERGDSPLVTLAARGEESLFRTMVVYFSTLWNSGQRIEDL